MTDAEVRDPRDALEPGTLFADDYTVTRVIAEGGMGAVYEVQQRNTGQARALKVLHRWLADDDQMRQRFIDEARIGSRIESEHVVQVIDAGVLMPGGVPWYVMEFLRGETLEERITRAGPMSVSEALELFDQVAHAVGAAHRAGVVHCDLKPENIHIAESRRADTRRTVKVLDFGIAHVLPALKTSIELTIPAGSPGWLAPEQMQPNGHVTLATDVWALGLIAFYVLTGGSYWCWFDQFPAILAEIDGSVLEPASKRAAALERAAMPPPGFDDWFARCVDRAPARRFHDGPAAIEALRAVLVPAHDAQRPTYEPAAPGASAAPTPDEGASRVRMLVLALNEGERRGEVEARIRIGEELLARACREHDIPARTAAAYVARAWTHEQQQRRGAALDDALRAVALAREAPQAQYLLGVLRARRMELAPALEALDRAIALNPGAVAFVREHGRVAHLLGRYEVALADRRRVIELDPARADAWVARALTHAALGDLAAAEADLTCAIEREPGSLEALRARAAIRLERGDGAGALTDLDEGVSRSPGDGACWFERCRARRAVGDPHGAVDDLRHAAALGHSLAVQELRSLGLS
jgi:tetratricopeptide (TPR) repeat protein/tRNA A-37 threonylcarbamoyl transferase component Bud32